MLYKVLMHKKRLQERMSRIVFTKGRRLGLSTTAGLLNILQRNPELINAAEAVLYNEIREY